MKQNDIDYSVQRIFEVTNKIADTFVDQAFDAEKEGGRYILATTFASIAFSISRYSTSTSELQTLLGLALLFCTTSFVLSLYSFSEMSKLNRESAIIQRDYGLEVAKFLMKKL